MVLLTGLCLTSLHANEPLPDFRLQDANDHSSRQAGWVSPRDYRLQVSAYYFGSAG